jgi:S1-C subfamily serine protease
VNTSPAVAEDMQVDFTAEGVAVESVEENSFAARAGLQKGDVVMAINGMPIATTKDLDRVIRAMPGTWEIAINRGGEVMTSIFAG